MRVVDTHEAIRDVPWDEFFGDFCIEFGEQYAGPKESWPDPARPVSEAQESLFNSWMDRDRNGKIDYVEASQFVDPKVGLYGSFLTLVGQPDMSNTALGAWKLGVPGAPIRSSGALIRGVSDGRRRRTRRGAHRAMVEHDGALRAAGALKSVDGGCPRSRRQPCEVGHRAEEERGARR